MAIVKQVHFGEQAKSSLLKGINTIADAVKSTLGARGNTVLIESENHVGGLTITKDGVTVANSINLMNPTENLAVIMMKQAADKTAVTAGDGTTTSIVLTQGIVLESEAKLKPHMNKTEVMRHIRKAAKEVEKKLDESSTAVTGDMLKYVATISANNDEEIGSIISEAYNSVGSSGIVTVENSIGDKTYSTTIKGMKIDRGWASKYFVNSQKTQECILDNPYILVADLEINMVSSIEHLLVHAMNEKRPILIIGEVSEQVLNALNANIQRGVIKICTIIPPNFGYRKGEEMADIAAYVGGKYISEGTGDNLELVRTMDLGTAKRVVVGLKNTVIMLNEDAVGEDIEDRILYLESEKEEKESASEKAYIESRIANLKGGVAVITVGANSDIELKEKRDRVDDAVCATKAAIEGGILAGGGIALYDISKEMSYGDNEDGRVAWAILREAMQYPFRQILINAGKDVKKTEEEMVLRDLGFGYDVKDERFGDMLSFGIIDPTKVTKSALENAVSVATTILSTNCIITNVRAINE
jgi:chaperonin GroEL